MSTFLNASINDATKTLMMRNGKYTQSSQDMHLGKKRSVDSIRHNINKQPKSKKIESIFFLGKDEKKLVSPKLFKPLESA